jgi:single-strand DNA-binding protein
MLNSVNLLGRVGKDPEIRSIQSGDRVANLSLATTEKWKDKNGQPQEKTEWHKLNIWGALAEVVEGYIHKGDLLSVQGKIETRKWTDKNGQDRYSTEIRVTALQLIPTGRREAQGGQSQHNQAKSDGYAPPASGYADMDDEIPFD